MSGLVGGWRLESWSFVYDDGRPPEFPMGPDAKGYILYTPTGQVSATIMRADKGACFAYAGRYEVVGGTVFHSIELSTNAELVGLRSTRHIQIEESAPIRERLPMLAAAASVMIFSVEAGSNSVRGLRL